MKRYVVTSGCYSDYGIEKVFLDREKAELYCKYHSGYYNDFRVEEYNTADDYEPKEKLIQVKAWFDIMKGINNTYSSPVCTTLDSGLLDKREIYNKDKQTITDFCDKYILFIVRYYNENNISEEQAVEKVKKIGYDMCVQGVINLLHEGVDFDTIKEMIEEQK